MHEEEAVRQYELGNTLFLERKDAAGACRAYREAAQAGHAGAQYSLALLLAAGEGGEPDLGEAIAWLQKSAAQDFPDAQYELANKLLVGDGCPADAPEAVRLYRLAAGAGHSWAQYNLAVTLSAPVEDLQAAIRRSPASRPGKSANYQVLHTLSAPPAEAIEWFQRAAQQGHPDAQYCLASHYDGRGEQGEAGRWYRQAAEQGHLQAQITVARMLSEGEGVEPDPAEATSWFRRAAEQGDPEAQDLLGTRYFFGDGTPEDLAEAVRCYRASADAGHANGQFHMGVMYDQGTGVEQSDQEAARWWLAAAQSGHPTACFNLATMLEVGRGIAEDPEKALDYYRLAAESGIPEAQYVLAMHLRKSDLDESHLWMKRAAEQGEERAQQELQEPGPIERVVNLIITQAIKDKATAFRVSKGLVEFQVEDEWQEVMNPPDHILEPMGKRFEELARMRGLRHGRIATDTHWLHLHFGYFQLTADLQPEPSRRGPLEMAGLLRACLRGEKAGWVVFRYGTCVIFPEPVEDLAAAAKALLKRHGPVHAGTPSADFTVSELRDLPGWWAVGGDHPDILTFVTAPPDSSHPEVGLQGRQRREFDSLCLDILYVEDRLNPPEPVPAPPLPDDPFPTNPGGSAPDPFGPGGL